MMRILHWNIHGWADAQGVDNVDRVIEVVRDADPDVVSLVEVDEPWGRPVKLQQLADALAYHWAFVPAFEYREAGGFGNAILAKQPLRGVQQWQLLPPTLYDGTEPSEPRAVLFAELQSAAGPITFGSTHFPRQDDELRKHASNRLLDLLQNISGPYLVAGDFNQPSKAWVPSDLCVAPDPPAATYPTHDPTEPIDYCIASGVSIEAGPETGKAASDHLPILIGIDT